MRVWTEFLRARLRDLFTLLDISRAWKWVRFFPIERFNFLLFFVYLFFQFFFTLVDFFKIFFKIATYSSNKIIDIILVFGEAGQNYYRAERLYRNRYLFRHPSVMIRRILLWERRRIRKRNRKQINAEDDVNDPRILAVLAMINLNPYISTRELQRNLGIPYVIMWIQKHKCYLYHITLIQDVSKDDMRLRRQFCRITNDKRSSSFFSNVLFSDEASFHNNGQLNTYRHNCHYWSTYNPHWIHVLIINIIEV